MNSFSISELARFSGVKAHTIRMWEQRYNALKPHRTEGNTRYYDSSQLRRLLNIVSLADLNYKVSELCEMPDKALFGLIEELNAESANKTYEYFIAHLISAGMSYDETGFEKIYSHCILRYGMNDTYLGVIYPMLVRIGLMWSADAIPAAHEHFISNLLRQKVFTAIDSISLAPLESDSWLLFLPENEFHEIGLLFANYLIRSYGKKVIYLGSNVPFQSLKTAVHSTGAKNLLMFFVHSDFAEDAKHYLLKMTNELKGRNIFVATDQQFSEKIGKLKKIHFLNSPEDLSAELSSSNISVVN